MAKKTALMPMPPERGEPEVGQVGGIFNHILESKELSLSEKKAKLLRELGVTSPKKKYETKEERKEAAKKRAKERKEERDAILSEYGLGPGRRGPKLSKEEKRARRKARAKKKRDFMKEMAKKYPNLAKKYGIDPSKFKI